MTTFAISSGWPRRRIGICASVLSAKPGIESDGFKRGVSMAPGQTQLTRMPRPAYSIAVTRVRLMTPALAALYAPMAKSAKPRDRRRVHDGATATLEQLGNGALGGAEHGGEAEVDDVAPHILLDVAGEGQATPSRRQRR